MERRTRIALVLILLAGLGIRVGWGLTRPTADEYLAALPDQREYIEIARNILRGQGMNFVDVRLGEEVQAFRTPGYPLFLAACGGNVLVARLAQALIDTATILAAFLIARQWLSAGWSLIAGALVAFNPFLAYFSATILTETLFAAMLAWGIVLLLVREGRWWIVGGAILALSIMVRPAAIALPVVLGVTAAFVRPSAYEPSRRWPFPVGTTMLLLTVLALLPWSARNYRVLDQWVWLSTSAGFTLYDGFNPDATGASDQTFVQRLPQLGIMGEVERSRYLRERAMQFVRDNPREVARLTTVKIARTWSPFPLSEEFSRPFYMAVGAAYAIPLFLLVIAGLGYGTLPRAAKALLLAPAVYLTLTAVISVGSLRYRIPAEVPMAVLAAVGVRALIDRMKVIRTQTESEAY